MDDELLDLVDANDSVIGTINRKDYRQLLEHDLGYIRVAELFILNDEGKIWVPTRTATKTIAPNGYDYSAAGHVESGNDYVQTIIRETQEEINLSITESEMELIAKIKWDAMRYFSSIFLVRTNQTPTFNTSDFVSAEWLTPNELLDNIKNGHEAKNSLPETIVALQSYLAST